VLKNGRHATIKTGTQLVWKRWADLYSDEVLSFVVV